MGCVVLIPKRDSGALEKKKLTAVSTDLFVSIPKRGWPLESFFLPRLFSL